LLSKKTDLKTDSVSRPVLRIRDVYLGSLIVIFTHPGSGISDPGSINSNKKGVKKFVVVPFFVATIFPKFKIILFRSGIRKNPIPDPGSGSAALFKAIHRRPFWCLRPSP
jgi:hypothetical protein